MERTFSLAQKNVAVFDFTCVIHCISTRQARNFILVAVVEKAVRLKQSHVLDIQQMVVTGTENGIVHYRLQSNMK